MKLRVENVYNRKSLVLLMKATSKDLSNACKDELLQRHLIEGGKRL